MNRVPASRVVLFAVLTAAALGADLLSKQLVFADLGYPGAESSCYAEGRHELFASPADRQGESAPYVDGWLTFRLLTSFNRGALWGVGQRYTSLFAILSLAAAVGIPLWLFAWGAARSQWLTASLALVLGGTLGNLYDRMGLHGCLDEAGRPIYAVRDFLLFTFGPFHWPVFNVADMLLVTGASMLVIHSFLAPRTPGSQPASSGTEPVSRALSNSPSQGPAA
jgi:signal peptidase II